MTDCGGNTESGDSGSGGDESPLSDLPICVILLINKVESEVSCSLLITFQFIMICLRLSFIHNNN
ncbi:Protein of unknown function, partial [Gryllus bimaculatus]